MVRYSHLPIWKAAMELALHLEHAVYRFSRHHNDSLGQNLRACARRLCRLGTRANQGGAGQRIRMPWLAWRPVAPLAPTPSSFCPHRGAA